SAEERRVRLRRDTLMRVAIAGGDVKEARTAPRFVPRRWLTPLLGDDVAREYTSIEYEAPCRHFGGVDDYGGYFDWMSLPDSFQPRVACDKDLVRLSTFPEVERLSLVETDITDVGLANVGRLRELTRLSLACTRTTNSGLLRLKALSKLEFLDLTNTQVS